jgi:predicted negative regulator of RcsB-dependent stress response
MASDLNNEKDLNDKLSDFFSRNKKNFFISIFLFVIFYVLAIYISDNDEKKLFKASNMYQKIQLLENINDANEIVSELKQNFKDTPYAARASLFLGNFYSKEKKFDIAKDYYIWSIQNAIEPSIKSLAHFQLGLNYYLIEDYKSAFQEANNIEDNGFIGLKNYLLGDIYLKMNNKKEALKSYQIAFDYYINKNDLAKVVKTKIDAISQE